MRTPVSKPVGPSAPGHPVFFLSANINAVDRGEISDHGEVHVQIVANAGLKLIRLLAKGGVTPSVVKDHGLKMEDAEIIVFLTACFNAFVSS